MFTPVDLFFLMTKLPNLRTSYFLSINFSHKNFVANSLINQEFQFNKFTLVKLYIKNKKKKIKLHHFSRLSALITVITRTIYIRYSSPPSCVHSIQFLFLKSAFLCLLAYILALFKRFILHNRNKVVLICQVTQFEIIVIFMICSKYLSLYRDMKKLRVIRDSIA